MFAIRGATTVSENTSDAIYGETVILINTVMTENGISPDDVYAIIFSQTADLTKAYPAAAARSVGFQTVPLFSCQEPQVENSLEKCIRALVLVNSEKTSRVKHVYLKDARGLREDLND